MKNIREVFSTEALDNLDLEFNIEEQREFTGRLPIISIGKPGTEEAGILNFIDTEKTSNHTLVMRATLKDLGDIGIVEYIACEQRGSLYVEISGYTGRILLTDKDL